MNKRKVFRVVIDYEQDSDGSGGYVEIHPSHIANLIRDEYKGSVILVEEKSQ